MMKCEGRSILFKVLFKRNPIKNVFDKETEEAIYITYTVYFKFILMVVFLWNIVRTLQGGA